MSQWEGLCNSLIGPDRRQAASLRSADDAKLTVFSSPRERKEHFCSSNKTKEDFFQTEEQSDGAGKQGADILDLVEARFSGIG